MAVDGRRIHRLLALLRSVAFHMTTRDQDPQQSALHLADRLSAIGRAALTPVSGGTDLELLVLDELLAQGVPRAPISIRGPEVRLRPKSAELLRLVLHELAANAVKFGALCQPKAELQVIWWFTGPAGAKLHIEWSEDGVRMESAVRRDGFGSRVVKHLIASELHGSGDMVFLNEGILCIIEFPSSEALQNND
jgi:two-component sensor histidine kinase